MQKNPLDDTLISDELLLFIRLNFLILESVTVPFNPMCNNLILLINELTL